MPSKTDLIARFAETIADDDSHGYSQRNRDGSPDYDCSSLACDCAERAGFPVKESGASYTGNMRASFLKAGAVVLPYVPGLALQRGDILLNESKGHAAIYTGNNQLVEATGDEYGGIAGNTPGDQTGHEIHKRSFYNFPWEYVLRFPENTVEPQPVKNPDCDYALNQSAEVVAPVIQYRDYGPAVAAAQGALNYHGFGPIEVNGFFSSRMLDAVRRFQKVHKLEQDAVIGPKTWIELFLWR